MGNSCERFLERFQARNRLHGFLIRSVEDFAKWLGGISRTMPYMRASRSLRKSGDVIDSVTINEAIAAAATVRRRVSCVAAAEGLVEAWLPEEIQALELTKIRCDAARENSEEPIRAN